MMFWDKCTIQSGVFSLIPSFVIPGIGLQISYTVRDPFTICVKCTVCKKKNNNLLSCTWSMMWLWSSVFSFLKNCFWLEIITNKTTVCLPNGPPISIFHLSKSEIDLPGRAMGPVFFLPCIYFTYHRFL